MPADTLVPAWPPVLLPAAAFPLPAVLATEPPTPVPPLFPPSDVPALAEVPAPFEPAGPVPPADFPAVPPSSLEREPLFPQDTPSAVTLTTASPAPKRITPPY